MSVMKSWLVRASAITLPREDRMRQGLATGTAAAERAAAALPGQAARHLLGLGVVQLERLDQQQLEFGELLAGLQVDLLALVEFLGGRHPTGRCRSCARPGPCSAG
jgi:hypothetical protein